jgi:phosphate transport system substrate-binding protein
VPEGKTTKEIIILKRRVIASIAAAAAIAALSITPALASRAHSGPTLKGAGSSFDAPLFAAAFGHYTKANVQYASVGSGAGQTQLEQKLVNFGAFDVPILKSDYAGYKRIVQIPVALGGAGVIYNLGVSDIHLTGPVLANIYLGKITHWNDKNITKLNKGKKFPNVKISVVYRSDSSGTSYMFTDYLSKVSKTWKSKVGAGKSPAWPVGTGASHSSGVSAAVKTTPGAIGYVEYSYAQINKIKTAAIENRGGHFEFATFAGVKAAASQYKKIDSVHFSITNAPGKNSYPIASYSWVGIWQHQPSSSTAKALVALFKWETTTGQKYGLPLAYVPLPAAEQKLAKQLLSTVK